MSEDPKGEVRGGDEKTRAVAAVKTVTPMKYLMCFLSP